MTDPRSIFRDPGTADAAAAIQRGDLLSLEEALAAGVDPNATGDRGVGLLLWALLHQQLDAMTLLLRAGADPAQPDAAGVTPMHYAAQAEDPVYAELLLAEGGPTAVRRTDTGGTPLHDAVLAGRLPQVGLLLSAGADMEATDASGSTPLHQAAKTNDPALCLYLLERGADAEAVNAQGVTFQRYLSLMDDALRNGAGREAMQRLRTLLSSLGVAATA